MRKGSGPQPLDIEAEAKRRGMTKALVLIDRRFCPSCGTATKEVWVKEPALFYFGGYGATRRSLSVHCTGPRCQWSMPVEITEENPRKLGGDEDVTP